MRLFAFASFLLSAALAAQDMGTPARQPARPTNQASETAAPSAGRGTSGPLFVTGQAALHKQVRVIAYGDTRFTDTAETTATNPAARQALVARIFMEKPDAVVVSGDLPWHGGNPADYAEFRKETTAWRDAGLRVYPALGNHEFSQCDVPKCLANWWGAFPEMPELNGRRWYSAQLGDFIYVVNLDSALSLLPGSPQRVWLAAQLAAMPATTEFVLINLHHPPVADVQTRLHVDHNPRANEIALRDYLTAEARTSRAKFVVVAGHIHNYERFEQDGVTYFVSGGGGAEPYEVERTPEDKYQNKEFPNYHYIRFTLEGKTLKGEMVRLKDAGAKKPEWEVKDRFEVRAE